MGFLFISEKIITLYRHIRYNLYVMRQSACLVFNSIMVDNYAASYNCTPMGRASDSLKLFILVGSAGASTGASSVLLVPPGFD